MTTLQAKAPSTFFPDKGVYRWILLAMIFLSAFSLILYDMDIPPMDFHPTRQYRSFLLARALYAESFADMTKSDEEIALAAKPALLEPPIAEYIASFLYRVFGGENMMIPRLMSILYWMVAGVFIYLLAKDLISPDGGIIAASFFSFSPVGGKGKPELPAGPANDTVLCRIHILHLRLL